jgi:hypothetical protein
MQDMKHKDAKIKNKTNVTISEWISLVSAKLYQKEPSKVLAWLTKKYDLTTKEAEYICNRTNQFLRALSNAVI